MILNNAPRSSGEEKSKKVVIFSNTYKNMTCKTRLTNGTYGSLSAQNGINLTIDPDEISAIEVVSITT